MQFDLHRNKVRPAGLAVLEKLAVSREASNGGRVIWQEVHCNWQKVHGAVRQAGRRPNLAPPTGRHWTRRPCPVVAVLNSIQFPDQGRAARRQMALAEALDKS